MLRVDELARFDSDSPEGSRLRGGDRQHGDLIERVVENDVAAGEALRLWWVVRPAAGLDTALRLSRQPDGTDLLPTRQEAKAAARHAETAARLAAEQRIAELEEERRRRASGP